jgi:hypothetical protein
MILVHKDVITLHVLALGMLTLSGFEALLGGLRTYLFSNTSNHIDIVLAKQLFAPVRQAWKYAKGRRRITVARAHALRHAARTRCVIQEMPARAIEHESASAEEVHTLLMMQWTISPDWTSYETEHYNFFLMAVSR